MKIKITADSTCDLSAQLVQQWGIALMPMHILMGEQILLDGVTVHPADVFAHVQAGGKMSTSAAANLVEYAEFFAPFSSEYDAVIHISVSSKLSSCYQNACLAAGQYENVTVIDSQNICTGQGYLVLRAAQWAAEGLEPAQIAAQLEDLVPRIELSFVLDQLEYMAKSGRCSGVLAFGANLLHIRPSLAVQQGELKAGLQDAQGQAGEARAGAHVDEPLAPEVLPQGEQGGGVQKVQVGHLVGLGDGGEVHDLVLLCEKLGIAHQSGNA